MDMTGREKIAADRATVWAALNDPEMLRRCIPGCQKLERTDDNQLSALAVVKVGPISARFQGLVTLSEIDPLNGYRISGEGQGGVAGHARGSAYVRLEDDGEGTILSYEATAQVGGKLAQLGARMIDATARTMAGAFFSKFSEEIVRGQLSESEPAGGPKAQTIGSVPARRSTAGDGAQAGANVHHGRWIWLSAGLVIGASAHAAASAFSTTGLGLGHVALAAFCGFIAARLGGQATTVIVEQRSIERG